MPRKKKPFLEKSAPLKPASSPSTGQDAIASTIADGGDTASHSAIADGGDIDDSHSAIADGGDIDDSASTIADGGDADELRMAFGLGPKEAALPVDLISCSSSSSSLGFSA